MTFSYQHNLTLQAVLTISHFQPHCCSQLTKQEPEWVHPYMLYPLAAMIAAVNNTLFQPVAALEPLCPPPAPPSAHAGGCTATRSCRQFQLHRAHLDSGEAGILRSYKSCFKKFSRFYHFSQSLQFSFLAFEKRRPAVQWLGLLAAGRCAGPRHGQTSAQGPASVAGDRATAAGCSPSGL